MCKQGLKVIKFERTGNKNNLRYQGSTLEYEFINSYPISVASMPVSYDSSSLLKCTVSFSYIRYIFQSTDKKEPDFAPDPDQDHLQDPQEILLVPILLQHHKNSHRLIVVLILI
jgi:hypothetical protein